MKKRRMATVGTICRKKEGLALDEDRVRAIEY